MISIELLATAPEKQGRGHASALVQSVNTLVCAFMLGIDVGGSSMIFCFAQADSLGRAVWVVATDARGFYETMGYEVVRKTAVGQNSPRWKEGGPFTLYIVSGRGMQ